MQDEEEDETKFLADMIAAAGVSTNVLATESSRVLSGIVKSGTGKVVGGAKVSCRDIETGVCIGRPTFCDASGRFTLSIPLTPAKQFLTIQADGFRTARIEIETGNLPAHDVLQVSLEAEPDQ